MDAGTQPQQRHTTLVQPHSHNRKTQLGYCHTATAEAHSLDTATQPQQRHTAWTQPQQWHTVWIQPHSHNRGTRFGYSHTATVPPHIKQCTCCQQVAFCCDSDIVRRWQQTQHLRNVTATHALASH